MRTCKILLTLLLLFSGSALFSQVKYEREYRIRKEQFPAAALEEMAPFLEDVRRLRFYREIDSSRSSYEMKFRKVRLNYSVEFTPQGQLEDVEIEVRPVDIPDESWGRILEHLNTQYPKYRVRRIQQQYPRSAFPDVPSTLKNAFQNLLLPQIRYELIVQARTPEGPGQYEYLFDSEGGFLLKRKSLPPNYDHVLY